MKIRSLLLLLMSLSLTPSCITSECQESSSIDDSPLDSVSRIILAEVDTMQFLKQCDEERKILRVLYSKNVERNGDLDASSYMYKYNSYSNMTDSVRIQGYVAEIFEGTSEDNVFLLVNNGYRGGIIVEFDVANMRIGDAIISENSSMVDKVCRLEDGFRIEYSCMKSDDSCLFWYHRYDFNGNLIKRDKEECLELNFD